MENVLLMDIGNTRLKWNVCEPGSQTLLEKTSSFQYSLEMLSSQLADKFGLSNPNMPGVSHLGGVKRAVVSNVGGQAVESRVKQYLQNRMDITVEIVKPEINAHGIINGYDNPDQLGVDRWVGMVGARTYRLPQAVCVVSCGTVVTIDFMLSDGQHLGGLITDSKSTIVSKVARKTADIKEQGEITAEITPFGTSTEQALANGSSYSMAGCIQTAVEQAKQKLGTEIQIILTGGAANEVRVLLPSNVLHDPDLIMKGLLVLARSKS